jgi:hypothetical protein
MANPTQATPTQVSVVHISLPVKRVLANILSICITGLILGLSACLVFLPLDEASTAVSLLTVVPNPKNSTVVQHLYLGLTGNGT